MKKFLSLIICSTMLLSTVSCEKNTISGKSEPTSGDISASETSSTTSSAPTTTTEPQMHSLSSPYEYMSCLDRKGIVVDFAQTADNKLIAQTVDYGSGYGGDEKATISVIDPLTDSIVRSFDLQGIDEKLLGIYENGYYVVENNYSDEFEFFDLLGNKLSTQPKMNFGAVQFSHTDDCLYYAEGYNRIKKYLSDGSSQEVFNTGKIGTVTNITPQGELVISEPAASDFVPYNSSLYSISTQEKMAKIEGDAFAGVVSKGRYSSWEYSGESGQPVFSSVPINGGEIKKIDLSGYSVMDCRSDPDSQYLLIKYSDAAYNIGYLFFDPATGKAADLGYSQTSMDTSVPCYVSALRRWFICTGENDQNGSSRAKLITADPELLDFDIQFRPAGTQVYTPTPCGEKLRVYRDIADDIEKEFGVRILIGNEVFDAVDDTDYTFTSFEDTMFIDPETTESDDVYIREVLNATRSLRFPCNQ